MNENQKAHELIQKCWHDIEKRSFNSWVCVKCFKCFERSSELDKLHPDYSNNIADAWELMLYAEKRGLKPYIGWGFVKIGESEVKFEYLAEVPAVITKAFIEVMENLK